MEANDRLLTILQSDIAERKGGEKVREDLKRLIRNVEASAELNYGQTPDQAEGMRPYFHAFLKTAKELEESRWTPENARELFGKVAVSCQRCHTEFRD